MAHHTILRKGRNVWCEQPVRGAGLLVDADDYFRAFYEAASKARRSILVSGWQFDTDVELLRGDDAKRTDLPVTLKKFLTALCDRNEALQIRLLAWDFHVVFAIEREWMQKLIFDWTTNERLSFRFDSSHVDKGCHHQKFVVIDGELSFVGGLDLCDDRWDERSHREQAPLRVSRGKPHKPFHDVQCYLAGREVAASLEELFWCRWKVAGGEPLALPAPIGHAPAHVRPSGALVVPAQRVSLSRTDPHGTPPGGSECTEIRELYVDAIAAADRSIYIETQYFSSRVLGEALVQRLKAAGRPPLDIVLVLNMKAENLKEEIAVGLGQAKLISDLRKAVEGTDHRLGIYYTVPATDDGHEPERATYVHAKVMIVDDRFLNVGSANLTNRSLSVDTELNASFESERDGDELSRAIANIRRDLVAEHVGVPATEIDVGPGLVERLDARAKSRRGRLRLHPSPTDRERTVLGVVDPSALPFDPDGIEEDDDRRDVFVGGLGALWRRLFSGRDDAK